MGIIDRIAGTLEELTGEGDADAREEIALAVAQAERGDVAAGEARLAEVARQFPALAPAFLHLGRLRAARGALDDAVTALGKAVDLDGDSAEAWAALGDALARLGRTEPARDALRHAVALATDATLRGLAHAALGRVHADAGQLGKAVRELRKAQELLGDEPEVELAYGRALARADEPEGGEWLTRAARRAGAPPGLFAEAAAATRDAGVAERLLREGLARAPGETSLQAALARHLARTGRAAEALTLALASVAASPSSTDALASLREAYAGAARWREALAVARREAELDAPPAAATRLALALAAGDREAIASLADAPDASDALPARALRAFLAGDASDDELVVLARFAPDASARRFVVGAHAPPPPPAANLVALLTWAHEFAARAAPLASLTATAGRAVEAFDRPLLVAVMGEFNAGKSSFVNALVGDEVAPTGVTPTTATVNILRYGPSSGARVVYHDGTVRELGPASVDPFLRELSDAQAASVRVVEIFHPLEALRRVEIVDTPGLNSIRPEHEKVARDFLVEADALVWVFALGQAAKASEKEALTLARGAGKHVLGVLNKIDGASDDDVRAVMAHVKKGVGALVDDVVPFSATRALAARRAGAADAPLAALEAALERSFFGQARALKRATAVTSLQRFVAAAAALAPAPPALDFCARRAALDALDARVRGALARERVALRARIDEAYRAAAFEVRDFVRPRAWLFGEHRADASDEQFLVELLEDAVERATDVTFTALGAALAPPKPASTPTSDGGKPELCPPEARAAVADALHAAIERFTSYARGVIEGGAVAEFFRHDLPRLRLDPAAIRTALTRRAPDPEHVLFGSLAQDLAAAHRRAHVELDAAESEATIRAMLREEHLERPLAALGRAVEDLVRGPAPGPPA
jgi:tetratricopeptide (TPR) repeat protein/GTP-binding protein EngB required for normal cell division